MIVLPIEQRSPEWFAAHVGIPTASQFARIVTPKKLEYAAAAEGLMAQKLAEWLMGRFLDEETMTEAMERGEALEPQAIAYYEMQRDCEVERVGFVLRDDRAVGCSPDGLVGEDGGLEIKCPKPEVHMRYLMENVLPSDYKLQVHGCLWLTGRKWWDFLSYHPELPPFLIRVERDAKIEAAIETNVSEFIYRLTRARTKLIDAGHLPAPVQTMSYAELATAS